ncbi:MAG: hypothetical protein ACI3Z7_03890, partial [Candidatus Aphodosoma sp.]
TGDTRIFSPLLYQLSYGTSLFASAKVMLFLEPTKLFTDFFLTINFKLTTNELCYITAIFLTPDKQIFPYKGPEFSHTGQLCNLHNDL